MSYFDMDSAPRDGTWILIRGRNAAGHPMTPVVCAWKAKPFGYHGAELGWRDSASLRDMNHLITDVPPGHSADWAPLPTGTHEEQNVPPVGGGGLKVGGNSEI